MRSSTGEIENFCQIFDPRGLPIIGLSFDIPTCYDEFQTSNVQSILNYEYYSLTCNSSVYWSNINVLIVLVLIQSFLFLELSLFEFPPMDAAIQRPSATTEIKDIGPVTWFICDT